MIDRYIDYLKPFDHSPISPARPGFVAEQVYVDHWKALMAKPHHVYNCANGQLVNILMHIRGHITQRSAAVAATFVMWQGCNAGSSIAAAADRAEAAGVSGEVAFLGAWSYANKRHSHCGDGHRMIESMLAPRDHWGSYGQHGHMTLVKLPKLTMDDYEVCDHVACWLGSPIGKDFRQRAEAEISIRRDAVARHELQRARQAVSA